MDAGLLAPTSGTIRFERAEADLAVPAERFRPSVDREALAVAPMTAFGGDQRA
jgi:hypothetical protein